MPRKQKKVSQLQKELTTLSKQKKANNTNTNLRRIAVQYNKAMKINNVRKKGSVKLHEELVERANIMKQVLKGYNYK